MQREGVQRPGGQDVPDRGSSGSGDRWQSSKGSVGNTRGLQRSEPGPCGESWEVQRGIMWSGAGWSTGPSCPQRVRQGRETWCWLLCPFGQRLAVQALRGGWCGEVGSPCVPGVQATEQPLLLSSSHCADTEQIEWSQNLPLLLLTLCGQNSSQLSLCLLTYRLYSGTMTCTKV